MSNPLDQITQTAFGSHTQTFTYGTFNGRPDELYSVTDSQTGTTSYTYDQQGNLATRNGVQYQFDYGNRLRNVTGAEGSYAYDGAGRRVQQTNASGTIDSFYDSRGQLIYQQDRGGGTHDYLYLQGHLVAVRDYDTNGIATGLRYQHTDAQGSLLRQTDPSGAVITGGGYIYDAFGNPLAGQGKDNPGYTGHMMDASTNLIYMQQRYYDPTVMRFLSMDPVDASNADGSNLDRYWYAKDNPYRYEDPNGMCAGSHITDKQQNCANTGGDTAGTNGAAQGMMKEQAQKIAAATSAATMALRQIIANAATEVAEAAGVAEGVSAAVMVATFAAGVLVPNSTAADDTVQDKLQYDTYIHYGYAAEKDLFTKGMNAGSFATRGPIMTGAQAEELLALPPRPSLGLRDSYYTITVMRNAVPVEGPEPVLPKYGHNGGGIQYYFPSGTPAGSVNGPFPLPQE